MSLHDIVDYLLCVALLGVVAFAIGTHDSTTVQTTVEAVVEAVVVDATDDNNDGVDWSYIDDTLIDSGEVLGKHWFTELHYASDLSRDDFSQCIDFIYEIFPWSFWDNKDLKSAIKEYGSHYEPINIVSNVDMCAAGAAYTIRDNSNR